MADLREMQLEALEELCVYDRKLLEALPTITGELSGELQPDTMDLLQQFLEGMNWVIGITNLTLPLINKECIRINEVQVSNSMKTFNDAFGQGDILGMVSVLENGIQLFLEDILRISEEVLDAAV